ncbi:MAG: metallophosphoesterase [Clostridia bacterium]|nr:metallophosphoesterase [Clostridia bacterium]
MKHVKKMLAWTLSLCLLLMPFNGSLVFAFNEVGAPQIDYNIENFTSVLPTSAVSVEVTANGDATLSSCSTRLEGVQLSTEASFTFTPADYELTEGVYTLVTEATDSNGLTAIETLSFNVRYALDIGFRYNDAEELVPSLDGSVASYYSVEPLTYVVRDGSTQNGKIDVEAAVDTDPNAAYKMQYMNEALHLYSVSGIPYQQFDVALNGKTDGEVAVRYTGSTHNGERIALKVYNPSTEAWDTLGTFMGSDSVSAAVDVATYAVNDTIHVVAVLDYVTNGSDTMIWSTDPQHYTKFEDLYSYYYRVYQYAAEQYVAGNAGYIITTGDLVDDRPSSSVAAKQWQVADQAMSYVDAVGMPNGLVSGNHDVGDFKKPDYSEGAPNVDYSKFYETFPASRYNTQPWYGGSLNNNASHYDLITIGNVDFLVMYLGYGVEATDETIAWANEVLQQYPHRTAIVTTHQYLDAGAAVRDARAQLIFDEIVDPNPNVKAVLCGHDDGSLCLPKTASDGRTVYEILCDYQFVEAEDPDFYENEHYIGSVGGCCGDGYIRLMTVKGETLSSITYSPVTGRYNPYGDRENIAIDLDCGTPDRYIETVNFSAYVVGEEVTDAASGATAVIIKKTADVEEPPVDEPVDVKYPATPSEPYTQHSADYAPTVETKIDLLNKIGVTDGHIVTGWEPHGNTSALNINIDLTQTPYLYYSIEQPADSNFTFALVNNTNYAPWLLFRDINGEGAYMNSGNANWDSYQNREQYTTVSETGCVDLRTYSTDPNKATWIINQITFYNSLGKEVVVDYMFIGSEAIEEAPEAPTDSEFTTYHHVSYAEFPEEPASVAATPVDLANYLALVDYAEAIDLTPYTAETAAAVAEALAATLPPEADNDDVMLLYTNLSVALGELKLYVEPIDETNLVSLYNYDFDLSKWYNQDANVPLGNYASHIKPTVTENGGLHMERSASSTNTWPSAIYKGASSITLKPNNGKIYVKLNVVANSAWCIYLETQQGNSSAAVRLNFAIENAFNNKDSDGFQGTFQGVYDVTEAFVENGFDPSATLKINRSILYIVPGDVTYDYIELLTDPAAETVDTSVLQGLIDEAATLTETDYTSATWTKLTKAVTNATNAINNAESAQADINLQVINMRAALAQLKKVADIIEEPANSLLPADEGNWIQGTANTMNIYRDEQKYTVLQNTNNQWPYATYTLPTAYETTVADHQITVDVTVGSEASILLNINNTWIPINKYITSNVSTAGDLQSGTYTVGIPFSSITELADVENASISQVRVFAVGAADASKVTLRKLMVDDYVAPPPVEDECFNLIPEKTEDVTIVSGDGTVKVEDGVLTVTNNGDTDLRVSFTDTDLFNLEKLNALHMVIDSEPTFKMAYQILNAADPTNGAWPNTSNDVYSHLFTVEGDRVAAGEYDVYMEMRDHCALTAKSSAYYNQFIILLTGKGTFTLSTAEMVPADTYVWPTDVTYGDPATPDAPYAEHAAKNGPAVEHKVDLLPYFNAGLHPTMGTSMIETANGLNLSLDLAKTPYLYYSVIIPEGAQFTFSIYSNSNYSPWLTFLDDNGESKPWLNQGAANWDGYTAREQYSTVTQTGCIDLRDYLKTDELKWVINQMKFYPSTTGSPVVSYFFVGSEPIKQEPDVEIGDLTGDGVVNTFDAFRLYAIANGKTEGTPEEMAAADMNADGVVNTFDALLLYAKASGKS